MRASKALRRRIKRVRRWCIYYLLLAAIAVGRRLPHAALRILVCVGSPLAYLLARRDRTIMRRNLEIAFRDRSAAYRDRIASRVFLNLGRMGIDVLVVQRRRAQHLDRTPRICADWQALGRLLLDRGSVAVSCHLGCWELLAGLFANSFPGRLAVIARRIYFPPFNEIIAGMRRSFGVRIMYQDEPLRPVLRHLKQRNALGILPDQDIEGHAGIFVPFFGVDAWTPVGPAALSLAAQVPVFVVNLVWDRTCYRLVVEGPLPIPDTGSRTEDIRILTLGWTQIVERLIRQYPDQWVWFHRRWRTRPV